MLPISAVFLQMPSESLFILCAHISLPPPGTAGALTTLWPFVRWSHPHVTLGLLTSPGTGPSSPPPLALPENSSCEQGLGLVRGESAADLQGSQRSSVGVELV